MRRGKHISKDTYHNGYFFRSRLEARHAVFFDTLEIRYCYEFQDFNLGSPYKNIRYLPDFYIPSMNCYIEIKGEDPTREEITKAYYLSLYKKTSVYIFYGDIGIPNEESGMNKILAFKPPFIILEEHEFDKYIRHEKGLQVDSNIDDLGKKLSSNALDFICSLNDMGFILRYDNGEMCLECKETGNLFRCSEINEESWMYYFLGHLENSHQEIVELLESHDGWSMKVLSGGYSGGYCDHFWYHCPKCSKSGILCDWEAERVGILCECSCQEPFPMPEFNHPDLIKAYTAARQARFEHGESGYKRR